MAIKELPSAHISNIETAHTKVSLTALVSIANAPNVSLDEIVCDGLENSTGIYTNSLAQKLDECNIVETRIISETIDALKKSLKNNKIKTFFVICAEEDLRQRPLQFFYNILI